MLVYNEYMIHYFPKYLLPFIRSPSLKEHWYFVLLRGKFFWSTTQFHMEVYAFDELRVAECTGDSRSPVRSHLRPLQPSQWT
jgi:hypothetical protein